MTDAIKWAVPIKCKVKVLADNDISRGLRGQDPTIPFGTEVRLSDPLGWLDWLRGRSSKTRVVSWPHGVLPGTTHIAFRAGDPAEAKLMQALFSRTAY